MSNQIRPRTLSVLHLVLLFPGSSTAALQKATKPSIDNARIWSILGNLQDGCFVVNNGTRPAAWAITAKGRAALIDAGLIEPQPTLAQETSPPSLPEPQALHASDHPPSPELQQHLDRLEAQRLAALYATPTKPYRPGGTYTPSPWHPARADAHHANLVPSREGDRCTAYAGIKSQSRGPGQGLMAPSRLQQ